jgi:hypothetical protein
MGHLKHKQNFDKIEGKKTPKKDKSEIFWG